MNNIFDSNSRLSKILLILILWCSFFQIIGQKSRTQLEKEKKDNLRRINQTNKILDEVYREKKASLGQLNALKEQIRVRQSTIDNISEELAFVERDLVNIAKSKSTLEVELNQIKAEYGDLVYAASKAKVKDKLIFLFSAKTFNQFIRRIKYMLQYASARKLQVAQIKSVRKELEAEENKLAKIKLEKETLLLAQIEESNALQKLKKNQQNVVKELSGRERELKEKLEQQQEAYARLEKLIADMIRKEIKRISRSKRPSANIDKKVDEEEEEKLALTPEAALISSSFAGNKNRLPWPVTSGFVASGFGKHEHPVLKKIIVDNLGIDIQTNKNEKIRSVFEGEVGFVAQVPGMAGKIISIKHGEYFTVYGNLEDVYVTTGQKVKSKESIGQVLTDREGQSLLQFQIWKNNQRMNPEHWLSKN